MAIPSKARDAGSGTSVTTTLSYKKYVFGPESDANGSVMPSVIASKTGRHTFPQWDQVLMHEGAHHPALNPYKLWLLVILISSLSLVGYVATRWLGSQAWTQECGRGDCR